MTTLTEKLPHAEGFLISEAPGMLSRQKVTLRQRAEVYRAGTVLGVRDDAGTHHDQLDPDSTEGNSTAVAILLSEVDASEGNTAAAVIDRLAEVHADELIWPDGISDPDKATAIGELLDLNIKVRSGPETISAQET